MQADNNQAPAPCYPVPSQAQVEWQRLETYAFIHFGPNTFTDMEWGYGDTPAEAFNPTRLDCEQWVQTIVKAGMKGVILTCKHHDGFCLWPSKYTDYSVASSPFKRDVVRELSDACKKYGIKFGVYLSPWDRHQASYGTSEYVTYYYNQLEELMTQYGDIFEVWFDGANGGDGWYGGACEKREIDRSTYYNYPKAWGIVNRLQPGAVIFSDGGPGCRWVGNEDGIAGETNWSLLRSSDARPAYDGSYSPTGVEDGTVWVPAECDVSIRRPNWFYHRADDEKNVLSADALVDLYYKNVGRNATFLLNVPVTRTGRMHEKDVATLKAFREKLDRIFAHNLLSGAAVSASNERGGGYEAARATDGNYDSYWATADGVCQGALTFQFDKKTRLNRLVLQEYIPLGQRVKSFVAEYSADGKTWHDVNCGEQTTTIGHKRILVFPTVTARQLRIRFTDAKGPLCINSVGAYLAE